MYFYSVIARNKITLMFIPKSTLSSFLFYTATDVVTVYVYQEPSLLSSLQDNGLTDVVLHALLVKDVRNIMILINKIQKESYRRLSL